MKSWRGPLLLVILALGLVGADRALRWARAAADSPAAGAEWIWARMPGEAGAPMAFFAVKDFELDFEIASADLRIVADEEYLVTLNGRTVAVGSYLTFADPDAPSLASYSVGNLLRPVNRLLVELRSARGAGGLLFKLVISGTAGERAEVVSDGSWRIVRRFEESVRRFGGPLGSEAALVWGAQPAGRWGLPETVVQTWTLRALQNGRLRPLVPAVRQGRHGSPWRVAPRWGTRPLGPWARLDFGRVRTGYLNLHFADSEASHGFVFYDLRRPPEGLVGYGDVVLRIAGRNRWTASRPASFRFVTLTGIPAVTRAEVVPVNPDKVAELLPRQPRSSLFGVEREKTLVSPVEDEIRSQLEGVPGLARRKEG
jgi:hypothetical protein